MKTTGLILINFMFLAFALVSCHTKSGKTGATPSTGPYITTIAGTGKGAGVKYGGGDAGDGGPATRAELGSPGDVVVDADNNVYIADNDNEKIRKIDGKTGIISTFAGGPAKLDDKQAEGGPATKASMGRNMFLCLDKAGNLYVASYRRIRKIDAKSGIITTFAGNNKDGYPDDDTLAVNSSLGAPHGMCFDDKGNLYFADEVNNVIEEVVAKTGKLKMVAGNPMDMEKYTNYYTKEGDSCPALKASLNRPSDVAFDKQGNMYIADALNGRIRKVDHKTGIMTTIVGSDGAKYNGSPCAATSCSFAYIRKVMLDSLGNIYFNDEDGNRICKMDISTGKVVTVAGNGTGASMGDDGPPQQASINQPAGFFITNNGQLYIADTWDHYIREVKNR